MFYILLIPNNYRASIPKEQVRMSIEKVVVFQSVTLAVIENPAETQTGSLELTNGEASRCLKPELVHQKSLTAKNWCQLSHFTQ
jgi:hypothetical protein